MTWRTRIESGARTLLEEFRRAPLSYRVAILAFTSIFALGMVGLAVGWLAERPNAGTPLVPKGLPASLPAVVESRITPPGPEGETVSLRSSQSSCSAQLTDSLFPAGNVLNPSAYHEFPNKTGYDAGRFYGYVVGWPYVLSGGCLKVEVEVYTPVLQGHPEPVALTIKADPRAMPQYGTGYQVFVTPHLTAPTFEVTPLYAASLPGGDVQSSGSAIWNWYVTGSRLGSQPVALSVDVELRSGDKIERTLLLFRTQTINIVVEDPRSRWQRIVSGTSGITLQGATAAAVGLVGLVIAWLRVRVLRASDPG